MDEETRAPEEETNVTATQGGQTNETTLLEPAVEAPEPDTDADAEQTAAPQAKRGVSRVTIALVTALAVALGIGAAMCGRTKAPEPEPGPPAVEQAEPDPEPEPVEPEELTEGEVEKMLGELEWDGEDVSPAEEDEVEVVLEEGHLMVTVSGKTDPAKAAEWAARRAAALAEALEGRCEDVTVVSAGEGGEPLAAVTYDAKAPEPAEDLAGLLSQARGHAIADDAYEAMGEEPGVPQRAGEEPMTPKGEQIVPEPAPEEESEPEEGQGEPEGDDEADGSEPAAASDASKSTTPSGQSSGGATSSGGAQSSGGASSSAGSSSGATGGGTSSGTGSSGGSGSAPAPAPEPTWIACATCGGTGTVTQTVCVSGAWDEQVVTGSVYVCSHGLTFSTDAALEAHLDSLEWGTNDSYWVENTYTTVHHDAVYQDQAVTCPSCGGLGGHVE